MLKRIRIDGYKSFKPLDLELGQLAVLMGPNAVGKSNLLDAIYLISRLCTCQNLTEAFEGHRGLPLESMWYGDTGIEGLLAQESVTCTFEVDVALSKSVIEETEQLIRQKRRGLDGEDSASARRVVEKDLRYRIQIEMHPKSGVLRVREEDLRALGRDGQPKTNRKAFLEKSEQRLRLRMEGQAGRPTEYQIGLDHTIVSSRLYEPHYPHLTAFRLELEKWRTYYLEPRILMREDVPLAETRGIGPQGEKLAAFLNTLKSEEPAAFKSLQKAIQTILPSRPTVDVFLSKEGTVGLVVTESGVTYAGRLISEGTLRVLGLLATVHPANSAVLVGYEEPENGVHPVRLGTIAEILQNAAKLHNKQVIVTTHSPLFARLFPPEQLYLCSKEGNRSIAAPLPDAGPLFRRFDIDWALSDAMVRGDYGG